jgi:peroxiredoxin
MIAVSPDRPAKLTETLNEQNLSYTLLSDSPMVAAKAFGLAFQVDDATLERYKGYGIDLDNASGESHHALPVPAVFLVTPDGRITYAYTNPDYKVRLDAQEILARL